jgi:histidinol-phosphate/aromatic aminotransferase/cobyric acid decarboxylase-like protein
LLVPVGDGASVARALLECGCAVRDCTSFGLSSCIRIGVRSVPDQDVLLAALAKVLDG